MNWTASTLSATSVDSEPSIMINFDEGKYMFNTGENTVRSLTHSHTNRKKVKAVFLTRLGLESTGGLPGMLMTLADAAKVLDLSVIGPKGLMHRLASARSYLHRPKMNIDLREVALEEPASSTPFFQDKNVSVYAYSILPSTDDATPVIEGTLKRRRPSSPDGPRKKLSSSNVEEESLWTAMRQSQFDPATLNASAADEWRKLIVNRMFPDTKPSQLPTGNEAVEAAAVDDYKRRQRLPKGWFKMLPSPVEGPALEKQAIAYVLVGPAVRGKFDAPKALALGVPNGRLRGKLANGETVTFEVQEKVTGEDGQVTTSSRTVTVRAEECIGPAPPRAATVVLDCPSPEYIPHLVQSLLNERDSVVSRLRPKTEQDKKEMQLRSIFHLLGRGVLEDPRYVAFMNEFGDDVQHIVSSKDFCPNTVTFTSAAANQARLNRLDPEMFPLPKYDVNPVRQLSSVPNLPRNTVLMESNLSVPLHPPGKPTKMRIALTKDLFQPMLANKRQDGTLAVQLSRDSHIKFKQARDMVSQAKANMSLVKNPGDDVVVVPLGTGSAIPGQYRTVSSTLIQIPGWGNVLLDAGEGTYFQLARHFGEKGADDVLRNVKCIFASHSHADHIMGITMLLRKRAQLDPPPEHPMYFVTIHSVHLAMLEEQQLMDLGIQVAQPGDPLVTPGNGVIPIFSEGLHYQRPGQYLSGYWAVPVDAAWQGVDRTTANAAEMRKSLGLDRCATVDMQHGTRCFGFVMWHKDGWSIAFSGDTEPTDRLVRAAKGVTLLIHEATMSDDEVEIARAKKHSTFAEAIDIGTRMGAQKILLTHFSARHPKIPVKLLQPAVPPRTLSSNRESPSLQAENTATSQSVSPPRSSSPLVVLAFDQSNLRLGDMWKMQYYLTALEQHNRDMAAVDGDGAEEDEARLNMIQ